MRPQASRASSPNPTANLVGSRKAGPQTPRSNSRRLSFLPGPFRWVRAKLALFLRNKTLPKIQRPVSLHHGVEFSDGSREPRFSRMSLTIEAMRLFGLSAADLQLLASSKNLKGALMKRCPRRFLMVALCALVAFSAFGQFQTGNLYGKAQAKDGSFLPGVSITLTGVGAPHTTVTDGQGLFRFPNLSPGQYTVKAELSGYGTATRTGLSVSVGQNVDISMTLNPSMAESITVTAEAPLLDTRKTGTGTSVTKVELEKIPTSRDPWTVMQSVPSVQVDRINVGGSQSGQQSVYYDKGAQVRDRTWNMDGVNITDMGATGSSPLYFDFDSFEEMQITTGGSDPRIETPGVQLNMVTKRGTNDIRGSGRYFYTPGSMQADATVPTEAAYYLAATNKINFVRDYGAEAGGPVWKDHIWFWAARGDQKISNQASSTLSSTGTLSTGLFDNIVLRDKNAKLNAQI